MKHDWRNWFGRRFGCILAGCLVAPAFAADPGPLELPPPHQTGGMPLMQALKERQTQRNFKTDPLDAQQLSDLLWAAFGINRPTIDHRTAPSAMNSQEVEIYVATRDGLFHYEPKPHRLQPAGNRDLRVLSGGGDFAGVAPVTLIYVADLAKLTKANPDRREFYAATDTGFISQNVYLYCASAGLATVVHDLDRAPLSRAMGLRPDQEIILAQAVGFSLPPTAPAAPANPK
ncbi:MAG: SagB/ThcOx family dehydrogenase [Verrucomicrobiota bacterium]|jgi:nitroreductase